MDPHQAPVPEQPDVMCALAGALAARATENTFDSIVAYSNRIPEEYAMLMIKDATTKDSSLTQTRAFAKWAMDHKEALGA